MPKGIDTSRLFCFTDETMILATVNVLISGNLREIISLVSLSFSKIQPPLHFLSGISSCYEVIIFTLKN